MKVAYNLFYRKNGIRLMADFTQPKMGMTQELFLPLNSVLHYVTYDGIQEGPSNDEFLVRDYKRPISVNNKFEIGDYLGNPRRLQLNEATFSREYFNKNKRYRPLKSIETVARDPQTLILYNYCMVSKMYKYLTTPFTAYHKWHNHFSAVVKGMAEVSNATSNKQYLVIDLPDILPSLVQLEVASRHMNQTSVEIFNNPSSLFILEVYKYIVGNVSVFDLLDKKKLPDIVFILKDKGAWVALNFGELMSFVERDKEQDALYAINSNTRIPATGVQRRFLVLLLSLTQTRTKPLIDESLNQLEQEATNEEEPDTAGNENPEDTEDETKVTKIKFEVKTQEEDYTPEILVDEYSSDEQIKEAIAVQDTIIEDKLKGLNEITTVVQNKEKPVIKANNTTLEQALMSHCDKLAEDGLISAGEYKRFERLSKTYKTMPFTKDGKTMEEFIQIKPEDLLIEDKVHFKDQKTVFDKTMLKSSLEDFDRKYITKTLDKHIVSMVLDIQRAGVAVTGYEVETQMDITGTYEAHTVRLTPVEGQPSTIRFKIPKINEDGTFESNLTKYRMRHQRGDLPIRKINSAKVALTSYYGKTFINRGLKKVNDYAGWLKSQVMSKVIDNADKDYVDPIVLDSFDQTLKAPRAFSIISTCFKTVKVKGFTIYFSNKERQSVFPPAVRKPLEVNNSLLIGINDSKTEFLILDSNGVVHKTDHNSMIPLGTLEEFMSIDNTHAPIDFCDVVIAGKDIPIGIVLAYHFGLKTLLDILKVTPRRINAGEKRVLDKNEYAISFSDETLIFDKSDEKATLILAGFREYHKAIKLFSVYSFDKKGVYLNILETAKLGVRQIREMDLIFNMFVDPITKTLLEQMGEPQTFEGLLFRAVELLITDDHPDELDPDQMRIKGYERIAGAIYNELIISLKKHNSMLGKKSKAIEMHPYAVWKRITEDPAKMQMSEINPVHALKETEAVTYSGVGGRSKRSMTKNTRAFHPNDLGTISESTVDSSDVAINVFTTANPQFTSLLGLSRRFDAKRDGATAMLSTTALLSPGAVRDDYNGPL